MWKRALAQFPKDNQKTQLQPTSLSTHGPTTTDGYLQLAVSPFKSKIGKTSLVSGHIGFRSQENYGLRVIRELGGFTKKSDLL